VMESYGPWHYILGYLIVLTGHNWPIMLCTALGLVHAVRLYRHPRLREVQRLYGWALLGFAYEYHKHLRGVLDEAVDFLVAGPANRAGHGFFAVILPAALALGAWLLWASRPRRRGCAAAPTPWPAGPRPERG
jgi:hypothetical protein